MSFMFNFDAPEDVESVKDENASGKEKGTDLRSEDARRIQDAKSVKSTLSLPAHEVTEFLDENIIQRLDFKSVQFGDHHLRVVDTSMLEQKLLDDEVFQSLLNSSGHLTDALTSHSDLVAGVYEGGLKVWECGVDLAEFLSSHPMGRQTDWKGKTVLELGCGAGLPGLYCCQCGAQRVDFQDYNEEVLKLLTHTNVTHNQSKMRGEDTICQYFAGDWAAFAKLAKQKQFKYDIILTAETIYSVDNYSKLHDVFTSTLSADGVIFLAAKTYYFGVGGSIEAFIEYVGSQNVFSVDTVYSVKKGVPRKVLALHYLSSPTSSQFAMSEKELS